MNRFLVISSSVKYIDIFEAFEASPLLSSAIFTNVAIRLLLRLGKCYSFAIIFFRYNRNFNFAISSFLAAFGIKGRNITFVSIRIVIKMLLTIRKIKLTKVVLNLLGDFILAAFENDLVVLKLIDPITFIVIVFISLEVFVKSRDLPALLKFLIRVSMLYA